MTNADGETVLCTECGKICYTKREAGSIINSLKRHRNSTRLGRNKEFPRRKYFCTYCGYYHLPILRFSIKTPARAKNQRTNEYCNRIFKFLQSA